MFKKWLCFLAVVALSLTACTSKKTLVVGLDENFPPMGFRDGQGNLVGFDIDMAKEALERMGMTAEFQPIDWGSKEMELSSKKVDLLWNGLTITEKRKESILFSNPYLNNRQVIMVQEGSPITQKADLAGKTVGLQKDSSAVAAVQADVETAASLKDIVEYTDNILAFTDLEIGRLDAVVVDEIVAKYYITNNNATFTLLAEDFGSEEYGVGMRLEDKDLRDKLQSVINQMIADGKAAEISKKWFGEDIVIKP